MNNSISDGPTTSNLNENKVSRWLSPKNGEIFPVGVWHYQAQESSIVTDSIINSIAASEVDLEAAIEFIILSVTIKTIF